MSRIDKETCSEYDHRRLGHIKMTRIVPDRAAIGGTLVFRLIGMGAGLAA